MIANNQSVTWVPESVGSGRFGQWLDGNVDWAISRDRYWGTPLPIWICDDPGCLAQHAVGSMAELEGLAGEPVEDPHRPFVDELTWACGRAGCSGTMRRTPEVADAWFDSGSMPFAQWHYPFENKEKVEAELPADFISEAVDQTRGWFYTLLAVSTLLDGQARLPHVRVARPDPRRRRQEDVEVAGQRGRSVRDDRQVRRRRRALAPARPPARHAAALRGAGSRRDPQPLLRHAASTSTRSSPPTRTSTATPATTRCCSRSAPSSTAG